MTDAAPAHALLSAAHSLLRPAMHHGRDPPAPNPPPSIQPLKVTDDTFLPIEESILPPDDITDLRDVVDAINKLCDTMKTSSYDADDEEPAPNIETELREARGDDTTVTGNYTWGDERVPSDQSGNTDSYNITEQWNDTVSQVVLDSQAQETWADVRTLQEVNRITGPMNQQDTYDAWSVNETIEEETLPDSQIVEETTNEMWSESHALEEHYMATETYCPEEWSEPVIQENLPGQTSEVTSDGEPAQNWEAASELYYTASSEVSLVSDMDLPERTIEMDDSVCFSDLTEMPLFSGSVREQDEKSAECVVAGHVAAMRERFESLTRSTTPCPEHRASTPALDLSRNVTPSPTQDRN